MLQCEGSPWLIWQLFHLWGQKCVGLPQEQFFVPSAVMLVEQEVGLVRDAGKPCCLSGNVWTEAFRLIRN